MSLSQPVSALAAVTTKLSVEHVSMVFERDGKSTHVLNDINLEVGDGEFVCLLGPSGCGKSTLLNAMAGFLSPTSGEIRVSGEVVQKPDPRRIFVFQERGVFPWLTVEGNIGFGLSKLPRAEREKRIAHYVKMVGLEGFEKTYPQELSGGMKQRLEVARALAVNPDMLLTRRALRRAGFDYSADHARRVTTDLGSGAQDHCLCDARHR